MLDLQITTLTLKSQPDKPLRETIFLQQGNCSILRIHNTLYETPTEESTKLTLL
jgi:hypothetical protein